MVMENQRAMSFRLSVAITVLSVTLLLTVAPVSAKASELRVLLAFDDSGHQVRRIVRSRQGTSIIDKAEAPVAAMVLPDISLLSADLKRGFARLVWLDDQGYVSAVTQEPDPRVSQAPNHITGAHGSRVAERKGAWLVTGPDSALSLLILMPGDETVGLGYEQWEVRLDNEM